MPNMHIAGEGGIAALTLISVKTQRALLRRSALCTTI
jgi:hypothetical protein